MELTPSCLSLRLKNGELIYGCKDARSPVADWSELAHHLKPFFFPSNGLAGGPHCTGAVIRELVRVITRVLLSGSEKGRAGALRLGPGPQGPRVCEASPFGRSLRHQGRPRWVWGRAERVVHPARVLPGLTEHLWEQPGPRSGPPKAPQPPWGDLPAVSSFIWVFNGTRLGCRVFPENIAPRVCASSGLSRAFLQSPVSWLPPWKGRFSVAGGEPGLRGSGSHSSRPLRVGRGAQL